jgi:hypothetical protein
VRHDQDSDEMNSNPFAISTLFAFLGPAVGLAVFLLINI